MGGGTTCWVAALSPGCTGLEVIEVHCHPLCRHRGLGCVDLSSRPFTLTLSTSGEKPHTSPQTSRGCRTGEVTTA